MFILYNDVYIILYADDTSLLVHTDINFEFHVSSFANNNKFKNMTKTKELVFYRPKS